MKPKKILVPLDGSEMAEASLDWKTVGYWCDDCLRKQAP